MTTQLQRARSRARPKPSTTRKRVSRLISLLRRKIAKSGPPITATLSRAERHKRELAARVAGIDPEAAKIVAEREQARRTEYLKATARVDDGTGWRSVLLPREFDHGEL